MTKLLNCAVCGSKAIGEAAGTSCSDESCEMSCMWIHPPFWNALQSLVRAARKAIETGGTYHLIAAVRRFDKIFGVKEKK